MKTIKDFIERIRIKLFKREERTYIKQSKQIYQICEYDGDLWLTTNNLLVCPVSFFHSDDFLSLLKAIRDKYVERKKHKEE